MTYDTKRNYIKHPKSTSAEVFKIATAYAREALKSLSENKILDSNIKNEVQEVIEERFSGEENKPFLDFVNLHYVQEIPLQTVAKMLNLSTLQAYNWRDKIELDIADALYMPQVMVAQFKDQLTDILKTDPDMIEAVCQENNLIPAPTPKKRGRKPKEKAVE